MSKVILGNHMSVIVPRKERDSIYAFYRDVLGFTVAKAENERDFFKMEDNTYIVFLYGDVPDVSDFSRTARSMWLELKCDNAAEMKKKILASGVRKLEVPDSHLYFQAPGGQCWRLVEIDEDLTFYEGHGAGPNVKKVKEGAEKGF